MIIIKVKIQDCDDLRRFSLEEKATFEEFSRVLSSIYPRIDDLLDTYSVKYTDDEGDLTSIESTESLADAIRQTSFLNPPVLRITLVPDKQRIDRSIQIPPSHSILFQGREITVPVVSSNPEPCCKEASTPLPKKPLVAKPDPVETKSQVTEPTPSPVPSPSLAPSSVPLPALQESEPKPYRFQNLIHDLSDECARKSLSESQVIAEVTQKMGVERAKEFGDFASEVTSLFSAIINKNRPAQVPDADKDELDLLCLETVNKCDSLNKSLEVQTQEHLSKLHLHLQEEEVDRKRLSELCESNIKTTYELASNVLNEARQHSVSILDRISQSLNNSTTEIL